MPDLRLIQKLGDASYAVYLIHPMVIALVRMAVLKGHADLTAVAWAYLVAIVVLSNLVALAIYRYLERPLTVSARRVLSRLVERPLAA